MSRFLTKILNEPPGGHQKTKKTTLASSTTDSPSNNTGPSTLNRPAITGTPSRMDSPTTEDSLSMDAGPPPPADSQPTSDGPSRMIGLSTKDRPNLLDAIPEVRGHTQLPHRYSDHLPRWLSADEQAVYVQLYRLSWGWGNEVCFISNP